MLNIPLIWERRAVKLFVVIAFVVALAVPTVAIGQGLLDGGDIQNSSLTGKDVKDKSLTKQDFRGSVRGSRGPRGLRGAQGPAGPTVLGRITRVAASVTVLAGDVESATVNCPPGQAVVSGGFTFIAADGEVFYSDSFGSPTSWSVGGDNFDSLINGTLTAIAWCSPAGQAITPASRNTIRGQIAALEAQQRAIHR